MGEGPRGKVRGWGALSSQGPTLAIWVPVPQELPHEHTLAMGGGPGPQQTVTRLLGADLGLLIPRLPFGAR